MSRWIMITTLLALIMVAGVLTMQPNPTAAQVETPTGTPTAGPLPNYGPAPELTNAVWLNTEGDKPLSLAALRGKVIALHFWTFDCINCIHTVPYVEAWSQRYAADGLVVIGDHFPEFSYEHDLNNLKNAVKRLGITYAVAQDNYGATWNAYNQMYWPTIDLIDKQGNLRYRHIGEGAYAETEAAIRSLLAEPYTAPDSTPEATAAPAE